jgi:hypothetical protein
LRTEKWNLEKPNKTERSTQVMQKNQNQAETKALGEILAETAPDFIVVTTTTTGNPSEADIEEEGE